MDFWCLTASSANPDTFKAFHRWGLCLTIISGFFTRGGIHPFLLIPDTYFLYHFNQQCDFVGRCPIYRAHPINIERCVDLPTMHSHPTQCDALVHIQCKMPLHVISCYMYNEHHMEQFINHTLCQVPWIIILKTYNRHPFMLIYITPIYQYIYNTFSML